MGGLLITELS